MNDQFDVIESLRHLDPVRPGSIDEAHCATAAELRTRLWESGGLVQLEPSIDHRVGVGRLAWWKLAAAIAVVGSAIAASSLFDSDEANLGPATPGTDSVGWTFAMNSPSADEQAQAMNDDLYTNDDEAIQISAAGNYVALRRCRDSASSACPAGWAFVMGTDESSQVRGGLLGAASYLDLRLLNDRYFVVTERSPGEQAPASAWLIDAVSGMVGALSWRDEPTTLNSPSQALLLCEESYNSFSAGCGFTDAGTPTEAGLPKVVDVQDGTIRPLAMPDNVVADLRVAQHGTGRIWIGTDPDGDELGLAYSDDDGATWSQVALPEPLRATNEELARTLSANPGDDFLEIAADGDRVAVAKSWGGDDTVYVSNDAGQSWTTATTTSEPEGNGAHLSVLADGRLVLMWSADGYPMQLFVSIGTEWTELERVADQFPDPGANYSKRFTVNRAGIAMIRSYVSPRPGSGSDMNVVDTIDFSTDLTNWSTIDIPNL